jgi:hypothetical protein
VPVSGAKPVRIYTARRTLEKSEKEAWDLHNAGMAEYYERSFSKAEGRFRAVLKILPEDEPARILREKCMAFVKKPPASDWDGTMTEKAS